MSMPTHPADPFLPSPPHASPDREALEARFALRVTAHLSDGSAALPHAIQERLRFAREQALARARSAARPAPAAVGSPAWSLLSLGPAAGGRAGSGGLGGFFGGLLGALGMACAVVALLLGLSVIEQVQDEELVLAAAEIDAALLADDLPPSAYADPGFVAYMRGLRP